MDACLVLKKRVVPLYVYSSMLRFVNHAHEGIECASSANFYPSLAHPEHYGLDTQHDRWMALTVVRPASPQSVVDLR